MNLSESVNSIESKADFVSFVEALVADLKTNPEEWENKTLQEYLEAIANWTEDMDGYYLNNNLSVPKNINWRAVANILIAAKIYE